MPSQANIHPQTKSTAYTNIGTSGVVGSTYILTKSFEKEWTLLPEKLPAAKMDGSRAPLPGKETCSLLPSSTAAQLSKATSPLQKLVSTTVIW